MKHIKQNGGLEPTNAPFSGRVGRRGRFAKIVIGVELLLFSWAGAMMLGCESSASRRVSAPRVEELEATLAKEGFASVAEARYARVSFSPTGLWKYKDWRGSDSCFNIGQTAVSESALERAVDDEAMLAGNGWVRTAAAETEEFLAFDAAWWDAAKGWRPNGEKDDVISLSATPVRLRRDLLRSLDTLNLLADGAFDRIQGEGQGKVDTATLAFALHACQVGFKDEAQQLLDALWRRPAAAKEALAKLRERISSPGAKCKTVREWYLLTEETLAKGAEKKVEKTGEGEKDADEEDDDESVAD